MIINQFYIDNALLEKAGLPTNAAQWHTSYPPKIQGYAGKRRRQFATANGAVEFVGNTLIAVWGPNKSLFDINGLQ